MFQIRNSADLLTYLLTHLLTRVKSRDASASKKTKEGCGTCLSTEEWDPNFETSYLVYSETKLLKRGKNMKRGFISPLQNGKCRFL